MIGTPLDRLRRHSDPSGALLSVFVTVPPDPTALRELPARLDGLLATARMPDADDATRRRARAALARVHEAGAIRGRDWFGQNMAIVASADDGVLEAMRLPCAVPDRAVFGRRAHVRLPLRAFQQCRPYAVVVIDRRQAWLFEVGGRTIRPVRRIDDEGVRDRSHAGWHGLDEYGVRHHAAELARRHYDATAAALAQLDVTGRPVVVGGHGDGVAEFLSALSPPLRDNVAGTFAIDPHTMTPDDVRAHAQTVMADREAERQRRLAADLAEWEAAGLAVSGVEPCADAVSRSGADLLVVRGDEQVPGRVCDRCGAMSTHGTQCRACGASTRPVPDVVDEMVARMLDAGAQVDLGGDEYLDPSVNIRLHGSDRRHAGRVVMSTSDTGHGGVGAPPSP